MNAPLQRNKLPQPCKKAGGRPQAQMAGRDRMRRGADEPRPERNALHRNDRDPAQDQRRAEHDRALDDRKQRGAKQRVSTKP